MLKNIFCLFFFLTANYSWANTTDSLVKLQIEKFDERIYNWVDKKYNANTFDQNLYGDGLSYILESLLTMFDNTGDRKYLDRFFEMALKMQENRNDQRTISNEPKWVSNVSMYQDGLICWPITHMIYNFSTNKNYQQLANQSFHTQSSIFNQNTFNRTFSNYQQIVDWLNIRIQETINFYTYGGKQFNHNGYWVDDIKCFTPSTNSNNRAQQLNMQSAFGASLFYLGSANQQADYLNKAHAMAEAFKGTQEVQIPSVFGCIFPKKTTRPVFELTHDNAYHWRGSGWRTENCKDNIGQNDDYEDISHAAQTLIFPLSIVDKLAKDGEFYYSTTEFTRFRNTFVNYVLKDTTHCPTFYLGVDGDDVINYNSNYKIGSLDIRALAFAPFTAYDPENTLINSRSILNKYFHCAIYSKKKEITTGLDLYSLALLIKENLNYHDKKN